LVLSFFGLTSDKAPEYRVLLFKQIHEIVFHGNGGYSWYDVYNMPRWLRLFTFKELENHYKNQQDQINSVNSKGTSTLVGTDGKIDPSKIPTPSKSSYK
jgi:hypothetical protein